jgi:hypothetical protein
MRWKGVSCVTKLGTNYGDEATRSLYEVIRRVKPHSVPPLEVWWHPNVLASHSPEGIKYEFSPRTLEGFAILSTHETLRLRWQRGSLMLAEVAFQNTNNDRKALIEAIEMISYLDEWNRDHGYLDIVLEIDDRKFDPPDFLHYVMNDMLLKKSLPSKIATALHDKLNDPNFMKGKRDGALGGL